MRDANPRGVARQSKATVQRTIEYRALAARKNYPPTHSPAGYADHGETDNTVTIRERNIRSTRAELATPIREFATVPESFAGLAGSSLIIQR